MFFTFCLVIQVFNVIRLGHSDWVLLSLCMGNYKIRCKLGFSGQVFLLLVVLVIFGGNRIWLHWDTFFSSVSKSIFSFSLLLIYKEKQINPAHKNWDNEKLFKLADRFWDVNQNGLFYIGISRNIYCWLYAFSSFHPSVLLTFIFYVQRYPRLLP